MKKMILIVLIVSALLSFAASLYAGSPAKAPDVVTLDTLKDKYEPVLFTHERHTGLAGNCGVCHHEHGNNGSLPCKSCHSLDAAAFKNSVTHNFSACKSCHGAYSPENPGIPGLKVAYHTQCFKCHRGMGDVGKGPQGCTELCHAKRDVTMSKKSQ
ncbi:MAG: cytochrome c family protein [Nitrospirae bacterium]|nr:cytochrome c family protein [Nitrospirota bacterium]